MKTIEFEKELKALDPRLAIIPNPNRPGLSNVKLDGIDVCPVPSEEIKEEPDPGYRYMFPNGMTAPHKSRSEVLDRVKKMLEMIETPEGKDIFYGKD